MVHFRMRRSNRAGEVTIDRQVWAIRLQSSSLTQTASLIDLLPESSVFEKSPPIDLTLDLAGLECAYPSFVAPFAAWLHRHWRTLEATDCKIHVIAPDDDGVSTWLNNVGFREVFSADPIAALGKRSSLLLTMPVYMVAPDAEDAGHDVAERVAKLIKDNRIAVAPESLQSLAVALAEIVENTIRHASARSPAAVCAQVHPTTRKLSVCVADAGIGIERSFSEAPYEPARARMSSGDHYLRLAVEPLMSSKYGMGHSGYGLFYTSRLSAASAGTFILTSGRSSLGVYRAGTTLWEHTAWDGTIVSLLLDTSKVIDGRHVWNELPDADGDGWLTGFMDCDVPGAIVLSEHSTRLFTRDLASKVLARVDLTADVMIDLAGVEAMTPSFADQLWGSLVSRLGVGEYRRRVQVSGASEYAQQVIEMVVRQRVRTGLAGE